jgi:hypothetical protein
MPVAAILACAIDQPLDLALGEIAPLEKRGAAACTVIAMQDGGTGAGAQHGGAGREANLIFVLPSNVYVGPPGDFLVSKFSSRPHPWKFGVKRFLVLREVLARKWGGLFWATSSEKIIGGVTAIVSYRPG